MQRFVMFFPVLMLFWGSFAQTQSEPNDIRITEPIAFNTPEADAICEKLQIFPPDHLWNLRIDEWPVHPDSDAMLQTIGLDQPLRYNADMNFVLVPPDQKKVPVEVTVYREESDPGPFPVPDITPIEGWPAFVIREMPGGPNGSSLTKDEWEKEFRKYQANAENSDADRHAAVIDPVNMIEYDFYQMKKTPTGWAATQSSIFNLRTGAYRPLRWTSSDAAGLPLFPAIVRYDELKNGEIKHALRVTLRKTRRGFVFPATHYASSLTDKNIARMGERFRLKADFDISGFSDEVKIILTALKKYGMLVADNGIDMAISVSPDERIPVLHQELRRLKASDFEVVETPSEHLEIRK